MTRFLLNRIGHGLLVIIGVLVVVFCATRVLGNPINAMLPLDATVEQRHALAKQLGFTQPLLSQFFHYISDIFHGNLGQSFTFDRPALEVIGARLPYTAELLVAAMALALVLGLLFGMAAALRPGSSIDRVASSVSLLGLSVPQFWLGLVFILVLGVKLKWLPSSGSGGFRYLILPAVTLALPSAGRLAMMTRSTMIDELNRPWIKVARAKGMPSYRTVGVHAFRNAAGPVVTLAGWDFIGMLSGGTVIVEVVFSWPGIGLAALNAVQQRDLVLLQAIVIVIAAITVVLNLLIDIAYKLLDPRVRVQQTPGR